MTHFFPSGITEGLLEHTWGARGGGGRGQAEQLSLKRDVTARLSLGTFYEGLHGLLGFAESSHGPAQAKKQGQRSKPQKILNQEEL